MAVDERREVTQMNVKKLLVIGAVALAATGSITGAALASAKAPKVAKQTPTDTTGVDTDNVQSGDQASPDVRTLSAKRSTAGGESSTEQESSGESNGENSGESDGPGGHQDPPGQDVNHEFDGEE
jgi:hypothetical protein